MIDTASNTVVATIPVGDNPVRVAITPDGTHSPERDDRRLQALAYVVAATIPVGAGPVDVAIASDGAHSYEHDDRPHQPYAYVTDSVDHTVSVIDTAINRVVATIPVGNLPFAVAFATVPPSHRNIPTQQETFAPSPMGRWSDRHPRRHSRRVANNKPL